MSRYEKEIAQFEKMVQAFYRLASGSSTFMELKVSKQQLFLLRILHKRGRLMVSELAGELNLSVSATTLSVNRLVKAGYILRERDEGDRRVVWLRLSERGRQDVEQITRQRDAILSSMFSRISEDEFKQLMSIMEKMLLPESARGDDDLG